MYSTHRAGHWWGDDWALYIRQAKGLLDGHPNRVLTAERVHRRRERRAGVQPAAVPVGLPADPRPVRRRGRRQPRQVDDRAGAVRLPVRLLLVLASPGGASDCVAGVDRGGGGDDHAAAAELDRADPVGVAVPGGGRRRPRVPRSASPRRARSSTIAAACVPLGRSSASAAAAAFTVRREGLAMVGAIGAAQLAAMIAQRAYPWRLDLRAPRPARARLALPARHLPRRRRPAAGDAAEHGRAEVRRHERHQRLEAARAARAQPGPGLRASSGRGTRTRWCSARRALGWIAVALLPRCSPWRGSCWRSCGTAPATCTSRRTRSARS